MNKGSGGANKELFVSVESAACERGAALCAISERGRQNAPIAREQRQNTLVASRVCQHALFESESPECASRSAF